MKKIYLSAVFIFYLTASVFAQNIGYGLQFNGADNAFSTSQVNTGNTSTTMTWEFWFCINTLPSSGADLADLYCAAPQSGSGTYRRRLIPYVNSDGSFHVWVTPQTTQDVGQTDIPTSQTITTNQWYYFSLVQTNSTTYNIYINGTLVGTGTYSGYPSNALTGNETLYLGNQGDWIPGAISGTGILTKIDEVSLWNTDRTASISSDMSNQLTGSETGLLAYYKLNEGTGTSFSSDITSGTLYNGSFVSGLAAWESGFLSPGIQASNVSTTGINNTSENLSWTRGNGNNVAVFMKQASSGSAIPYNQTTYTANSVFSAGSQIGSTGWYCVFNGTGTSVDVTGLTASTTYQIHVCEYYNDGSGNIYFNFDNSSSNPYTLTSTMPVELTLFNAFLSDNAVKLTWQTATEVNDYGFDVERAEISSQKSVVSSWTNIGFVNGSGTSNSPKSYSFVDSNPLRGSVKYRLKQIDNDGSFKYSGIVDVTTLPKQFSLEQNYPNPFNPTTTINFSLPVDSKVLLEVYNTIGQRVATLVNGIMQAGNHYVKFNADRLASGIYFYRMQTNGFVSVKKLLLLK